MTTAAIVGYVAAVFSVTAFAPQAWRIIKTRDTSSLATPMWILEVCAFASWVAYGVLPGEWPIIVTNTMCGIIALFILVMKLAPKHAKHKIADAIDPAV